MTSMWMKSTLLPEKGSGSLMQAGLPIEAPLAVDYCMKGRTLRMANLIVDNRMALYP